MKERKMSDNQNVLDIATPANAQDRDAFFAHVETLGALAGTGKTALPSLAVWLAMGVRDGALTDLQLPEKGKMNDVGRAWDAYTKSEHAKDDASRSVGSRKAQVSKLQAIANAAAFTATNVSVPDFVETMNVVATVRKALPATVKVKPVYDCFIDAARRINDKKVALTAEDIDGLVRRVVKTPALVERLEKLRDNATRLLNEKADVCITDAEDRETMAGVIQTLNSLIGVPENVEVPEDELAALRAAKAKLDAIEAENARIAAEKAEKAEQRRLAKQAEQDKIAA
jgi:hypothetical protein